MYDYNYLLQFQFLRSSAHFFTSSAAAIQQRFFPFLSLYFYNQRRKKKSSFSFIYMRVAKKRELSKWVKDDIDEVLFFFFFRNMFFCTRTGERRLHRKRFFSYLFTWVEKWTSSRTCVLSLNREKKKNNNDTTTSTKFLSMTNERNRWLMNEENRDLVGSRAMS